MIRIRLLGGAILATSTGPVQGRAAQRRRLALLALLAEGKPVSRDKLIALLWPEADAETARSRLSDSVYVLKKALGNAALIAAGDSLALNPDLATSDLAEFDAAIAGGEFERAIGLYGGPFLDGFFIDNASEFEHWADAERDRLARSYATALERLAAAREAASDALGAIAWLRRRAAHDPCDSRSAVRLMEALEQAGDRAGALQHARQHASLLEREWGVGPDAAVSALVERLQHEPARITAPVAPVARKHDHDLVFVDDAVVAQQPRRRWRGVALIALVLLPVVLLTKLWSRAQPEHPVFAVGQINDLLASDSTRIASALADLLATNLARLDQIDVVSHARVHEMLGQRRTGDAQAALLDAARRAGATDVLEGTVYRKADGTLRFDLRRVELRNGALRGGFQVEAADVFQLADAATSAFADKLGLKAPKAGVASVTTGSIVAYRFYEEGLRAYYQGDRAVARHLFTTALREDSTFAMAAFYAAQAEAGDEYFVRAVRLAGRAPDRERLLILAATATSGFGDPVGLAVAETLAIRYPTEPDGHLALAEALMARGELLEAVPHLERVIRMDSANPGATLQCRACDALGMLRGVYEHADSLAAAERVARRFVALRPRSTKSWRELAGVLEFRDKYAEAAAALRTAEQLALPSAEDATVPRFGLALRAGDFAEMDRLTASLRSTGSASALSTAAFWSVVSLRYQGRLREAIAMARAAGPAATPAQAAAQAGVLGPVLMELGRYRQAAALYDSVAGHPPYESWERGKIARHRAWRMTHAAAALAAAGDTSRLAALADTIEAIGRESPLGRDRVLHHHIRGLLMAARGKPAAAEAEFRQAILSWTAGYTRTNYELARQILAQHRPADAIVVLQQALRGPLNASGLYISRTDLRELLGTAFDAAGAADSAVMHYQYVVSAWQHADPELRARRDHAQQRLTALAQTGPRSIAARDPTRHGMTLSRR